MRRVILMLAFLAVAVGCGAQPANQLSDSPSAMTKAGSSRMEMTVRFDKNQGITGEGLFDYANNRGQMTVKPLGPQYKDSFPAEGLFIRNKSYSGWTLLGRTVWLEESDYKPIGAETFIPGPGGPRPDRVLTLLLKAGKKTEILGSDTIRGVKAQHYRIHLDPSKLGDRSGQTADPLIEAWVDGDGLVRRLEIPTSEGGPVQMIDFFDFGVPVDIQAPADDDVVTQGELDRLMHADCKQRTEKGLGVDESACTRGDVVDAGPIETMPRTATKPSK
jgi:hypothetical protein